MNVVVVLLQLKSWWRVCVSVPLSESVPGANVRAEVEANPQWPGVFEARLSWLVAAVIETLASCVTVRSTLGLPFAYTSICWSDEPVRLPVPEAVISSSFVAVRELPLTAPDTLAEPVMVPGTLLNEVATPHDDAGDRTVPVDELLWYVTTKTTSGAVCAIAANGTIKIAKTRESVDEASLIAPLEFSAW